MTDSKTKTVALTVFFHGEGGGGLDSYTLSSKI